MMMLPLLVLGVLGLGYLLRWLPTEERVETPLPKRKRRVDDLSSAEGILEERYAQGQISRGEYLEIREDLRR